MSVSTCGIGHQRAHGRIEEALDLVGLDAAPGEHARQQLRQAVPLRDRQRARGAALVEPVAPGAAADGALDAEEERALRKGDVHGRCPGPDEAAPATTLAEFQRSPGQSRWNFSSCRCSARIQRTVPVTERITTVSVSMTSLPKRTPAQHRAVGDAGRGEQAVAAHHVLHLVVLARIGDAHLGGALALLLGVEHQPALHLAADAAQRRRRQHAFRRAADAEIDVDAGCPASAVWMTPATSPSVIRRTDAPVLRTAAIRSAWRGRSRMSAVMFVRLHALGLGERADVFLRRRVEIDDALRIARADGDLVHVDVGRVEQRAAFGHRHGGDRARHVLGAERGAFERIDRDVDLRARSCCRPSRR